MNPPPGRFLLVRLAASLFAALLAVATLAAPPAAAAPRKRAVQPAHRASDNAAPAAPAYGERPDVVRFAAEAGARRGLPPDWLAMELAQARRIEAVRKLILPAPSGAAKNWAAYRARFIEPQRLAAGRAFWQANQAWLAEAEKRFGVPPAIVVALIGVETYYGRVTGNFRTLDALATLAFDFPPGRSDRSAYFRDELEEFFVLCAREGLDPQQPRGSFAGAMGLAQFMPGSLNRYAVDLDADGHVDLNRSAADAIGSVASYLAQAGWQRGEPTGFGITPPADPAQRSALLAADIKPSFSAAQLAAQGAVLAADGPAYTGPLALIELENGPAAPSYVAGTANFYAITRYNRSSYYAMAVSEMAQALGPAP
jgi:membrane-bound lytic murein transglycosylase B